MADRYFLEYRELSEDADGSWDMFYCTDGLPEPDVRRLLNVIRQEASLCGESRPREFRIVSERELSETNLLWCVNRRESWERFENEKLDDSYFENGVPFCELREDVSPFIRQTHQRQLLRDQARYMEEHIRALANLYSREPEQSPDQAEPATLEPADADEATGETTQPPAGRKSEIERDLDLLKEFKRGKASGNYKNQTTFAQCKGMEKSAMNKALKRAEEHEAEGK